MTDDEKTEVVNNIVKELKHEYVIVHKDQWRIYLVRTLSSLFLMGGVTLAAVLAIIYGSTTAATNREINKMALNAKSTTLALEKIKADWESGQIVSFKGLRIVDDEGNIVMRLDQTEGGGVTVDGPLTAKELRLPNNLFVVRDGAGKVEMLMRSDKNSPRSRVELTCHRNTDASLSRLKTNGSSEHVSWIE